MYIHHIYMYAFCYLRRTRNIAKTHTTTRALNIEHTHHHCVTHTNKFEPPLRILDTPTVVYYSIIRIFNVGEGRRFHDQEGSMILMPAS